jgi:hypothetical protein
MKQGKSQNTLVTNDPEASLPHEKDKVKKKQGRHKWLFRQGVRYSAPSSEVHEMDRASAIASNCPGVLAEDAAADTTRLANSKQISAGLAPRHQPETQTETKMKKQLNETESAGSTAAVIENKENTNEQKCTMNATKSNQELYPNLPENVRLIIQQIITYLMACTKPTKMFFCRSEICRGLTSRGALVDTALRTMIRHRTIEVVRSHVGGPHYCLPVRIQEILTKEAHDRCTSHWLAADEIRHWPRFVAALADGPRSLREVSEVIYLSPVPQSAALALLEWAGIITCTWSFDFTSERWAESVICQLRPQALA